MYELMNITKTKESMIMIMINKLIIFILLLYELIN